ncbi:Ribonuclease P protein subunit p40 [Phytophthora cinnamomi]|uniref:Ribonuclease P protein subunit p40 n=1 Tax=Phytophthora cinnamomi TaxID=4785 RepID=UPI003559ECF9|nr:Ribonuclease P protein subunit p40 [Phytophthora cinnamomi]
MVSGGKAPRRGAAQRRARLQGANALLLSGPDSSYPSSRLLVWHSRFSHAASRHESVVSGHALNQQLEVFLPAKGGKTAAQSLQWETGFYYEVKASVDMFLSPAFISEYLADGGAVFMVAKNAAVDAAQSAMLLPSGQLLLLVDAPTYQQLGVVGEKYGKAVPRTCRSTRGQKYVITLDLTSPTFAEEGENAFRDRVRKALSSKLEDLEMFMCAYNQRGAARTILFEDDDTVPRQRVDLNAQMTTFGEVFLPKFDAFYAQLGGKEKRDEEGGEKLRTSLQEAYDWLGLVACRLTDLLQRRKLEEYVSTYSGIPDSFECEPDSEVTTVRWRGLLAAPFCATIVEKVQRAVKNGEVPWGAVTVWGFPDVFVSWVQPANSNKTKSETQRREHGYLGNGSNNYTLLILPNDEYFMLQALGPHDATV